MLLLQDNARVDCAAALALAVDRHRLGICLNDFVAQVGDHDGITMDHVHQGSPVARRTIVGGEGGFTFQDATLLSRMRLFLYFHTNITLLQNAEDSSKL